MGSDVKFTFHYWNIEGQYLEIPYLGINCRILDAEYNTCMCVYLKTEEMLMATKHLLASQFVHFHFTKLLCKTNLA